MKDGDFASMKVIQINAVYKLSSTGHTVLELHEFLLNNEIKSYVACANTAESDEVYLIGSAFEKKWHALMSRLFGVQGYFSRRGTRKLINYMQNIKPDIVHLRNLHANYLYLPMLFSYLAENDIGTVITLHDCWIYTGKCTHYTLDRCYKWQDGCHNCPKLRVDNKSWFFDRTSKMWRDKKAWINSIPRVAVIGVSDWITEESRKSILGKVKIIKRIYNWIDLETFKCTASDYLLKKWKLENKFVILGVASKWSERKGIKTFMQLAERLDKNKKLILIGDIPECTHLPDNAIWIPATNNLQELVEYYSIADVFLQLSLEETFGKVVAEALACGTPVITIDSTANSELVSESCGIVLKSLELTEILAALQLVEKRGKQYYKDACRKFVENNFNLNICAQNYIECYEEVMKMSKKNYVYREN